jgi:hypothetical protein
VDGHGWWEGQPPKCVGEFLVIAPPEVQTGPQSWKATQMGMVGSGR